MADETINCAQCRKDFTFTEDEAQFYASKNLSKPKRCKPCRQLRKAQQQQQPAMQAVEAMTPPPQTVQPGPSEWRRQRKNPPHKRRDYADFDE